MADCIFCQVVEKKIPAFVVYSDDDFLGFLDINPLSPGHTLLIPKRHIESIFDMPEELAEKVLKVAKAIASNMKKIGATGVNLTNASGKSAEQAIPHFHLHIIPRKEGDEINLNEYWQTKMKKIDPELMKEIAERIKTENISEDVEKKPAEEKEKKPRSRRLKKEDAYWIKREVELA